MGGNAIKNTVTRRYNKDEFELLAPEVLELVAENFTDLCSDPKVIPYYRAKSSFGDMDIIVRSLTPRSNERVGEVRQRIEKLFGTIDIHHNDGVFSFPYKELQIDLIFADAEDYQSSLDYFSYNDLGNLLGRIAKSTFNVSYGHKGLHYHVRPDNSNVIEVIELTKDIWKILGLLRLSTRPFAKGFDNLRDVFDYVISSPYFNKSQFNLDNLNHINKTRNRKRKTYMEFLDYVKDQPDRATIDPLEAQHILQSHFPFLHAKVEERLVRHNKQQAVKKAAKEACLLHFGVDNHATIAYNMGVFRDYYQENPDIAPEYAAQFIYRIKKYGYDNK